ncbi:hypothetical protein [Klebsiella aerogenes]|uniref:hypothetical protein n=2 Tax=Klebsiella aerogenes TaxID=548 RepID=UPI0012DD2979|nr:hypothetical protein [Klebsiella aerogenes]EKZ5855721.1 hypothetical protein [Klebsiella aerogenes]EKZ6676759.1 hypothetical protein [Klebsiella aerogenes]
MKLMHSITPEKNMKITSCFFFLAGALLMTVSILLWGQSSPIAMNSLRRSTVQISGPPDTLTCHSGAPVLTGIVTGKGERYYTLSAPTYNVVLSNTHRIYQDGVMVKSMPEGVLLFSRGEYLFRCFSHSDESEAMPLKKKVKVSPLDLGVMVVLPEFHSGADATAWSYKITACRRMCTFLKLKGIVPGMHLIRLDGKPLPEPGALIKFIKNNFADERPHILDFASSSMTADSVTVTAKEGRWLTDMTFK